MLYVFSCQSLTVALDHKSCREDLWITSSLLDIYHKCHQHDYRVIWDEKVLRWYERHGDSYLELRLDVVLPSHRDGVFVILVARRMTAELCNARPTLNVIIIHVLQSTSHVCSLVDTSSIKRKTYSSETCPFCFLKR